MSDVAAFFARLDRVANEIDGNMAAADLVDDDVLNARGDLMVPMFRQRAERAGVDLDDLIELLRDRSEETARTVAARIVNDVDRDLETECLQLAIAAGMQFFLAGALWEQERHLPTLDMEE